ncbi:MAG: hypothetical protein Q8P40_06895 [Nitrospirota bacterium]|nr:hypothetical protein [Nitrospirota bacterium]
MQRENDVYLDDVWKHWEGIIMLYRQFEDKNPVMLLDIQEQRVYAYPYNELKRTLSKRSQELLKTQYEDAIANDNFVIFVRDNENKELRSYTFSKE